MSPCLAEFIGTALLVLLGNGVVANVVLARTKGHGGGWIVITAGWGLAVFVAVVCAGSASGGHLNPAATLGLALAGKFSWELVPGYAAAQLAGGFLGATLVFLFYGAHYRATDDAGAKLATFCTGPAIRAPLTNFFCEALGTFVLVFTVLLMADATLGGDADGAAPVRKIGLGAIGALPVGCLVFAIGLSLGGPTGYAINPARDLSPRLAHALLPIPGKGPSEWGYAWIPVAGPCAGAALAAFVWKLAAA